MACPTPTKQSFTGKADALTALDRQRRANVNISHVYRCGCGSWHLAGIQTSSYTHQRKRNHRRKGGAYRRKAGGLKRSRRR